MEKPIEKALDECLFFSVKKLDRMLNKLADKAFREAGPAPTYDFILLILREKDGIPQKDITQVLYPASSTIARFVEKLGYKGYVKTISKGRLSLVYLTERGRQFAKEVDGSWGELRQSCKTVLGNKASKELAQTVNDTTGKLRKK